VSCEKPCGNHKIEEEVEIEEEGGVEISTKLKNTFKVYLIPETQNTQNIWLILAILRTNIGLFGTLDSPVG
jgi:hypothetical protein